jgi:hypothetical protein
MAVLVALVLHHLFQVLGFIMLEVVEVVVKEVAVVLVD